MTSVLRTDKRTTTRALKITPVTANPQFKSLTGVKAVILRPGHVVYT